MSEPEIIDIAGSTDPSFAEFPEVFARAIAAQGGGGAALTVIHHGRTVVDLVGGTYRPDTVQLVFSVSKALTAIAALHAADAGTLDLDEPLGERWVEFRKRSTASITPRMVLSHRSGIASLDRALSYREILSGAGEEAVAAQEPYWEPGTRHGYHAFTFGPLMDGIFRRTLGMTVGAYLASQIVRPRGLDIWLGFPDDLHPRLAPVRYQHGAVSRSRAAFAAASGIPTGTTSALAREMDVYNGPGFARAGFPSSSGVASARSLAELFAATMDESLLAPASRRDLVGELSRGTDAVLGVETAFSTGMQLPFPQFPMFGPSSYGHEAAGGSFAIADPEADLVVAWTTDMFPRMAGASPSGLALIDTIRHLLRRQA
ncbi:serine hydrolase domain-containing protein [Salinibacterium sp. ZJ70]|uniref:serine hydrolase domain-containing protein n=1 Tax=Salinibacterium sp. ZJ70 TaxID=2708084 RepID=UPI00142144F8|nr:serine hydrolase domain-containing protein [Salinibacterium sp. ZJ70]